MSRTVIGFALGILLFYQMPEIPGWGYWAAATGLLSLVRVRPARLLLAGALGFAWAQLFTLANAPAELPLNDGPQPLMVSGQIDSLVEIRSGVSRFVFLIEDVELDDAPESGVWRVRLSWHDAPSLQPGDRLRLSVRLKPAHGYATPGAWDYEGWLYHQQIRYTGYVRGIEASGIVGPGCCWAARLRSRVGDALDTVPASAVSRGVLRALVIGDRSALSADMRRLFRDTGTSHLMAISGLHIGLVAALGFVIFAAIWRRIPALVARVPAPVAGAMVGLGLSTVYAVLAGFSLPTQRAIVMLSVFAIAIWRRRDSRPADVLATAAGSVLLWNPASVIAAGFWLSFGAVAAIMAVVALSPGESRWRAAMRTQLAVSLALWPILNLFGLPVAVVAPVVNLLLIPLFGLVIVPLALLGTGLLMVAPDIGTAALGWLARLIDALAWFLEFVVAQTGNVTLAGAIGGSGLVLAFSAVAMLLAPRGFPFRWLAAPLFVAVWLPRAPLLERGDFDLHVLDVGQGLSVVVETRHHTLVFDTGPAYPSGFSTVDAVLLPFLQARQRGRIDRLILSHGDSDHAGAAERLVRAIDVGSIMSGEPWRVGVPARACRAGDSWRWDGVDFEILHPKGSHRRDGNNASCVLRIANAHAVALLTGDIEATAEYELITSAAGRLASDLVVAPHHGSATSSSHAFVAAVQPSYVVFTAGWGNRYGFPDEGVDRRWRDIGARALNTASAGTVSFAVDHRSGVSPPRCQRVHARRFWSHVGGSADACHPVSSGHPTEPGATTSPISAALPNQNRPDWRKP